jgi:CheY-like chemotaxis protein/two-component sensor histidine kinase
LEASQLQSGLVRATLSGCDVEQLLAENLQPLDVIAKSKGIRLKLRRPKAGPVAVYTDRALFSRLVGNLVTNAIKYSDPEKGASRAVMVGIVPLSNRVRIDVIDNGVGIPKQHWKTIFEPFVQISNPERNRDKGLGLGLSIVASLLELLPEHRLDMRSVEGRWTRFSLEVPRYRGAGALSNTRSLSRAAGGKLESLYVFYVEDDESSRVATAALLSDVGILLDVAASVAEVDVALVHSERRPDLVISDFLLTDGKTAVDIARLFRARWDDEVPVLVLTGDATPPSPETIGGAAIVLRKPTAPEDLLNAIQNLCFAALSKAEDGEADGPVDAFASSY